MVENAAGAICRDLVDGRLRFGAARSTPPRERQHDTVDPADR
jgi:hypothetical protein